MNDLAVGYLLDEHSVGISAVEGGCPAPRKLLEPQELVVEHAQVAH